MTIPRLYLLSTGALWQSVDRASIALTIRIHGGFGIFGKECPLEFIGSLPFFSRYFCFLGGSIPTVWITSTITGFSDRFFLSYFLLRFLLYSVFSFLFCFSARIVLDKGALVVSPDGTHLSLSITAAIENLNRQIHSGVMNHKP